MFIKFWENENVTQDYSVQTKYYLGIKKAKVDIVKHEKIKGI